MTYEKLKNESTKWVESQEPYKKLTQSEKELVIVSCVGFATTLIKTQERNQSNWKSFRVVIIILLGAIAFYLIQIFQLLEKVIK